MTRAVIPVMINDLEFDALIDSDYTLEASIPEYTIEDGFIVSDAILLAPEHLEMTLFLTEKPVTWKKRHGSENGRPEEVIAKLKELYYEKMPVTVTTTDNTYTDMGISSVTFSKSTETGYAYEVPISLQRIRITTSRTTSIPDSYGKSGTTMAPAGTASTTNGTVYASGESSGSGSGSSYGSTGGGSGSSNKPVDVYSVFDNSSGTILHNLASTFLPNYP